MKVIVQRMKFVRPRRLALAAALLVAGVVLYAGAVRTWPGQRLDVQLFALAQDGGASATEGVLRSGIPVALAFACAALAVVVLGRVRPTRDAVARVARAALAVAVTCALAALLKDVLPRPFLGEAGYQENTFPSGHVAASAALALAVVSLWPRQHDRDRPAPLLVALGVGVVLLAGTVNVVGHAHRPSDVVGAILLAGGVHAAVSALGSTPSRTVRPPRPS